MKNKKGQVIIVLILIMTVALAIGIAVIQRSLSDVSTSSKVEQSSRAFSAAEAGIEKTLATGSTTPFTLDNNAQIQSTDTGLIPCIPGTTGCAEAGTQQAALEYPPLAKEEVAHVWLADPDSLTTPPAEVYKQDRIDVYWGKKDAPDKAALELTLVYYNGSQYVNQKWFLDNPSALRTPANNFTTLNVDCRVSGFTINSNSYQCKYIPSFPQSTGLMLLRARLLYNSTSQPFAVQAYTPSPPPSCTNCALPPQQRIITSTGISGSTQRTVKLYQINKVVPPYFDFAIFSTGSVNKFN